MIPRHGPWEQYSELITKIINSNINKQTNSEFLEQIGWNGSLIVGDDKYDNLRINLEKFLEIKDDIHKKIEPINLGFLDIDNN